MPNHKGFISVSAITAVALLSPIAPNSAEAAVGPTVPALRWDERCPAGGNAYQCATAGVPLDYDEPNGQTISVKLIKRPATDPHHRIGTLFFQSGGPGEPLTWSLPHLYDRFPTQVRERFDIVGFDQRGVGESTAVQCFPSAAAEGEFLSELPAGFPTGRKQEEKALALWPQFAKRCAERNPRLLPHVSTANAARDLDLLRQAVGDEKINYYGLSYGTFLGVTYANLFPDKVRAMVLDAILEPVAYTTGRGDQAERLGTALRLREDEDRLKTLDKFLEMCGATDQKHCAFSAHSPKATRRKYQALMVRLDKSPVRLGDDTFTRASTVAAVGSALDVLTPIPGYVDQGWPQAAELLQHLWQARGSSARSRQSRPRVSDAEERYAGIEQGGAIICAESSNPRDPQSYRRQAAWAQHRTGDIGRMAAWKLAPCATWPVVDDDRYTGPWNRRTAAPILIMASTYDPSDPYRNAVTLSHELARARLLTVNGFGHGVIQNRSTCAETHEAAYLVDGTLPARGTKCKQDYTPFTVHRAA